MGSMVSEDIKLKISRAVYDCAKNLSKARATLATAEGGSA
jgi:hypothetical protein